MILPLRLLGLRHTPLAAGAATISRFAKYTTRTVGGKVGGVTRGGAFCGLLVWARAIYRSKVGATRVVGAPERSFPAIHPDRRPERLGTFCDEKRNQQYRKPTFVYYAADLLNHDGSDHRILGNLLLLESATCGPRRHVCLFACLF